MKKEAHSNIQVARRLTIRGKTQAYRQEDDVMSLKNEGEGNTGTGRQAAT
jgi:hypothetical protein